MGKLTRVRTRPIRVLRYLYSTRPAQGSSQAGPSHGNAKRQNPFLECVSSPVTLKDSKIQRARASYKYAVCFTVMAMSKTL